MSTIFKNRVSFDLRIYGDCKKHIARHRRLAIFESLIESVIADGIQPENVEEHDKIFEPANIHEETFWKSCRDIAKADRKYLLSSIENGKKGGRPAHQKQIKPQELETVKTFIPPTKEQVLNFAKEQSAFSGCGGVFIPTDTAEDFWLHYEKVGWVEGNEHKTPIINWKSALLLWTKREHRYKPSRKISLKEAKAAQNHIELQKMLNGEIQ